ncbi:inorganic pyrophosphatase [Xylaria cubensis]|nr:inorganic pyrophosphatase [Xylaria cubensis]
MSSSRAVEQILHRRVPALNVKQRTKQCQPHTDAARIVINSIRRANHTVSGRPLAGLRCCSWVTPPPPSYTMTAVPSLHTQPAAILFSSSFSSRSLSSSSPLLFSVGTSTPAANIASRRSAQLARHFSSSPSSSYNPNLHTPAPGQSSTMASPYTVRKVAAPNSLEHRVYLEKDGVPVSPFHDIPLYANQEQTILNMIVEIPRWTNAKLEISKDELLNPIKQDVKKGKLRFVRNCFPHKGYLWNYGAFPQTWEDPNSVHPETKAKGDNDPLDVCEIGELVGYPGQIKQVKVLGVMALLDEEETDWKVIVVDVKDPLAPKLNDVEDVERHLPGLLRATNEWFRIYKIPDGKPENQFAFTGECKNKAYAMDVIHECAEAWEKLITGKTQPGGISTTNLTVAHSPSRVSPNDLPPLPPNENLAPEPIDSSIDKWFFISGAAA